MLSLIKTNTLKILINFHLIAAYLAKGRKNNRIQSYKGGMSLTDIQVRYWAHKENVRHNLATEELQARGITETERSNRANEAINKEKNLIQQEYNRGYLSEMAYHNRMTEAENKRHNVATEGIQTVQANASMLSASAAMLNARTQASIAPSIIALNEANKRSANSQVFLNNAKAAESRANTDLLKSKKVEQDAKSKIAKQQADAWTKSSEYTEFSDVLTTLGNWVGSVAGIGKARNTTLSGAGTG